MCDYSVLAKNQIAATTGMPLVSRRFSGSSTGFCVKGGERTTAVCLMPGTELTLERDFIWGNQNLGRVAIFRQLNKGELYKHHDALEFIKDGKVTPVMLGTIDVGIAATVIQLPAAPQNETERQEQTRVVNIEQIVRTPRLSSARQRRLVGTVATLFVAALISAAALTSLLA